MPLIPSLYWMWRRQSNNLLLHLHTLKSINYLDNGYNVTQNEKNLDFQQKIALKSKFIKLYLRYSKSSFSIHFLSFFPLRKEVKCISPKKGLKSKDSFHISPYLIISLQILVKDAKIDKISKDFFFKFVLPVLQK